MWDLLVLGAGPAGCAAALEARRAGLAVLLLEARSADPPEPGETLHPGVEPVFRQLGVAEAVLGAGFHRHRGIWVAWEQAAPAFQPYGEDASGPWLGFQAERQRLRSILHAALGARGAVLRRGCTPAVPLRHGDRVAGVLLDGETIMARWTLDATGRRAWLATALGLARTRRSPCLKARYGWDTAVAGEEPALTATETGWRWRAPLGPPRAAWVELAVARQGPGLDVSWRLAEPCAGPGFLLAGDAAVILDPASSHGALRALLSGIAAASLVAAEAAGRLTEGEVIATHAGWLRRWFEADAAAMRALYRRHASGAVAALFA